MKETALDNTRVVLFLAVIVITGYGIRVGRGESLSFFLVMLTLTMLFMVAFMYFVYLIVQDVKKELFPEESEENE